MRKLSILGIVCLMAIPMIFATVSDAAIDTKNIVGVWLFDEVDGKGISPDSSKNGNDAELLKGAELADDGKFEGALSLSGDDEFQIAMVPTSKSLDSCAETYTATTWVKLKKKEKIVLGGCCNDDHAIINFEYTCLLNIFGPGRGGGHGKVEIGSGQLAPSWVSGPTIVNDDKWHHIAFTYDGKKMIAYVDGKVDAETNTNGVFGLAGKSLQIGGMANQRPGWGLMDDVGIFNTALSEADINEVMDKGLGRLFGFTPVTPQGRLTTVWARVRSEQ
ncbi:MAG: LamG domain-containing protein [Candidatus Poribacteria bacterium]|nr:LamG domain-containing protein [Candidatus Poribacteria bacterium]